MDSNRYVRSRTSSTSSLRSPAAAGQLNSRPAHSSPDQLSAGYNQRIRCPSVEQLSVSSGGSSIPPTPAPTPNPLLQVSQHMVHEQLVAGIKQLRADEGYIDSSSFPATPAPSPFSPSPAQFSVLSPDQVAEGIQRLRDEERSVPQGPASVLGHQSGASSGQPPTPSSTPGLHFNHAQQLGVIPEHLAESIHQHLRYTDEGVDSTSSPGTPVPTPISPLCSNSHQQSRLVPEQLAAGIHRLKVEEGISSGGSSALPSTPAPTPFSHYPGGVHPEDLAAGISRLSVVDELENPSIRIVENRSGDGPNISEYFKSQNSGNGEESKEKTQQGQAENFFDQLGAVECKPAQAETFFDQLGAAEVKPINEGVDDGIEKPEDASVLRSCRESRVDLPTSVSEEKPPSFGDAKLDVADQQFDDQRSLQRRQSTVENSGPPLSLSIGEASISTYATPVAPTPVTDAEMNHSSSVFNPQFQAVDLEEVPYDRAEAAWMPSAPVAEIIQTVMSSTPGTYFPDRQVLTLPGVQMREDMQDPVKNLVNHYRGENESSKRHVLTADSVTQDWNGLKQLIQAGCLRAAVNLTSRLLRLCKQGLGQTGILTRHTPSSLRIWYVRFTLMMRLKQYSMIEVEAEAFGDLDKPDLYYEFYPETSNGRTGSMVPFTFRVLLAELPQFLGKYHDTIDRLYALLTVVRKMMSNLDEGKLEDGKQSSLKKTELENSLKIWKAREIQILHCLSNCAVIHKDYEMAISMYESILRLEDPENKPSIKSKLGRVYLQIGDVNSASQCFEESRELFSNLKDPSKEQRDFHELEEAMDRAFIHISSANYAEGLAVLKDLDAKFPGNPTIVNNMSVCLLYLGKLKDALTLLESNVANNPSEFLRETQVLNLSTLYELESSYANQKKQSLLDIMSHFAGDGANVSCLKF